MEPLTVREYRNNLAATFDRADEGERILIRRRNTIYALVSVESEDLSLSPAQQRHVDEVVEGVKQSWKQVKQMEAGQLPVKSAMDFINEL